MAAPLVSDPPAEQGAAVEQVSSRPDAVSAQVTARATGQRVEDVSQRTETSQVFALPEGGWALEAHSAPVFREAEDGSMVPIPDTAGFTSSGAAFTGAGARLRVSEGAEPGVDGSVALVELEGTGERAGQSMTLGWEGPLPEPVFEDGQAVFDEGVEVPVEAPADAVADEAAPDGAGPEGAVDGAPAAESSDDPATVTEASPGAATGVEAPAGVEAAVPGTGLSD
ncbi:hypothetical protein [Zafaria sp. J156]|uniref:hypothetical protein n=1 Tax=Zafaria sp. J156 TaxID=3116490 RepID=UPI002E78C7B0|nr:hypothetical protein [Zafaria sp. J156]